ncbi:xanthine dehydrogenase [Sneathiella sp. P13V-1]|uniref:XdhC family protein n=1 Tax=Sneathiella sp. P13V-1 TaxID=2697366 RepID=UPI00187B9093|nr:XdhC family protein [Sneathiella sp. P13V-1]MBE7637421.1 xanthine dehydrogenase [Sneathiella sp. P13V-1]
MDLQLLKELAEAKEAKRQVVVATHVDDGNSQLLFPFETDEINPLLEAAREALRRDKPTEFEDGEDKWFLNIHNPSLRMFIVGAVHIAQKLAPMAAASGYDVTVIDPRRSFGSTFRFPDVHLDDRWPDEAMDELAPDRRTAIVTLTHDAKLDDPALEAALKSDVFYIGALGSTRTNAKRHQRLTNKGFTEDDLARINGPVGLNIGAQSPAEIAISIMAEITAILRKGSTDDL